MKVFFNGDPIDLSPETGEAAPRTVRDVLRLAGINEERGIAVALESEVVRRSEWDAVTVGEGQHVEVLRAVQGG